MRPPSTEAVAQATEYRPRSERAAEPAGTGTSTSAESEPSSTAVLGPAVTRTIPSLARLTWISNLSPRRVADKGFWPQFPMTAGCLGLAAMELRLDGKTALITGASRGIGQAIAASFAEAGGSVMISSRKADALMQAKVAIDRAAGDRAGEVAWHVANAGDPEQAEACVSATVERFGSIDILVNNAATNPYYGPIIAIDTARADKTVRVNQSGYLEWAQAAWRAGMSERGGVVLNLASIGGLTVEGGIGWYNVTKAAVIHLTSQLAGELGPKVRVNALAPGLVKTEFARALWESAEESIAGRMPLRRLGEAEDIANAALFLCSDAASWITGHTLVIDGGAMCIASGGLS
jgi:NAD(P)-dependent dehydrogenase (short-subunit alcohol dehydrogenase family)